MASTAESGTLHKMKRTGRSLWKGSSQTTPQGSNSGGASPPLVVSDIVAPAGGNASTHVETPVPIPVPMRATTSTTTGPALKRKALATNNTILQAQKDWEKKKRVAENQGPVREANGHTFPHNNSSDWTRTLQKVESKGTSGAPDKALATVTVTEGMAEAQRLSEEALLQRMTELTQSASASSRGRQPRAYTVESYTPASRYAFPSATASSSPSWQPSAPDHVDDVDPDDGDAVQTGLQTNADNVSYYLYAEDDGTLQNTKGAPFPPGKERYDDPDDVTRRPFICPVRECRALSISMKYMAAHFHGKHNRSLFNDNGDGTFSKIGNYMNEDGSSPGIIVSYNPLSPGAPPPATPEYSESQKKLLNKKSPPIPKASTAGGTPPDALKRSLRADPDNDIVDERIPKRPKTTPVPLPIQAPLLPPVTPSQPLDPPLTNTLLYLHRFLSLDQQVPSRPDIVALSKYERVRNLPASWIDYYFDKALDPLHYACVLAYLVGTAEEKNPCRKWKGVSRLSDPCVALPSTLPAEARAAFSGTETCIACQYQFCCYRTRNECEWAKRESSPGLDGKAEEVEAAAESQQKREPAFESKYKIIVLDDDGTDDDMVANIHSHAGLPPATRLRGRSSSSSSSSKREPQQVPIRNSYKKSSPPTSPAAQASAKIAQKLASAEVEEMEEMEDWEVAPGTIKDERTSTNIGFSNAYMSDQHPITISPGVCFNVLILKPGHTYHWPEETNKVRNCSVGAGKVGVKMGSGQTFKLGPNGVVVIRPGQSCMVANRLYSDAVLHCTTFEDDFQPK
ncbi:hypothetical protein V8C37DRAFT_373984 [Trichoderma ceciliae]